MAKFYGEIGFCENVNVGHSVWKPVWTRRNYCGEVTRNTRRLQTGDSINDDVTITNTISIIADPYAMNHFHTMRYLVWHGVKWKVDSVDVQYPRLNLTLGGEFNEPISEEVSP